MKWKLPIKETIELNLKAALLMGLNFLACKRAVKIHAYWIKSEEKVVNASSEAESTGIIYRSLDVVYLSSEIETWKIYCFRSLSLDYF